MKKLQRCLKLKTHIISTIKTLKKTKNYLLLQLSRTPEQDRRIVLNTRNKACFYSNLKTKPGISPKKGSVIYKEQQIFLTESMITTIFHYIF